MASLFSCVCIEDDAPEHQSFVDRSYAPSSRSFAPEQVEVSESRNKSKKHIDRIVIYTGATGSRDFVDEEEDFTDDNFSETYSNFEYVESVVDCGHQGDSHWIWPKNYQVQEVLEADAEKIELLALTQRAIDKARKNYLALAHKSDFKLDNSTITRYLEANLWQPNFPNGQTIAERIMETIEWRCNFPLPTKNIKLLQTELATGKNFVHGKSKDGRPVVYLIMGRENTWNPEGNTLALVYTLERAIRSMKGTVQDTICIIDCDGVGMMNAPTMGFLSNVIEILGKHYPRRNGQIFICNVSSVFYFLWNAISVTLSDMTKKKIQILTNDKETMRNTLGKYIDLSALSSEYGGTAQIVFDVNSYLSGDTFLQNSLR